MKKDEYKVWNGKQFCLTLNKIAGIANITIPDCFDKVADINIADLVRSVVNNDPKRRGLHVCVQYVYDKSQIARYRLYAKKGGVLVSHIKLLDEDGSELPMILLESEKAVQEVWHAIGRSFREALDVPTIALTGSIGKTTLTMFLQSVFNERYKVFISGGNLNTAEYFIMQMFRNFTAEHNFHIQECGGGYPGCAEKSAKVLKSDAFVIANVLPHHLDRYKTIENILYDKTSLDRCAAEYAFGVINADDELLMNHKFQHRVVTCGIKNKNADYVAENIWCDKELHADIVHNGKSVNIKIKIPGMHNAYNALYAFAMAKEYGFSDEEIVNGFKNYKSGDIRQNIREVSGRTLYIDCFNISADSVYSGLATLNEMKTVNGSRRIAVIGGENGLGDTIFSANYEIGLNLAKYDKVDEFIFFGPSPDAEPAVLNKIGHAYAVYEGAKKVLRNKKISFMDSRKAVAEKLVKDTKSGDIIFFKGIIHLPLFPVFDMAFGTSYVNYSPYTHGITVNDNICSANYFSEIEGCNILTCKAQGNKAVIPNLVVGKPVHRIGRSLFDGKKEITDVSFGNSAMNIGAVAFRGTGIKNITIPCNIIHIEKSAFAACDMLETVVLEGVEHIEETAFYNCKNLKTVEIPATCLTIEDDVFKGCDDLTIIAPRDSYAAEYAQNNGINLKIKQ